MHLTPGGLGTQIIGPRLGLRDGGCGLGADDLAVLADREADQQELLDLSSRRPRRGPARDRPRSSSASSGGNSAARACPPERSPTWNRTSSSSPTPPPPPPFAASTK